MSEDCLYINDVPTPPFDLAVLPLAVMFEQAFWGMILCTAQSPYAIVEINDLVANWLDARPKQLLGHPLAEVAPLVQGEWLAAIARAQATNESTQVKHLATHWPDGKDRQLTILCLPVAGSADLNAANVLSLIIDLAAIPESTTDASELRLEQMGAVFTQLPIPVWLFDTQGRLRSINRATLQLFETATFQEFVQLVGDTIAAQFTRLQPRITSGARIAEVTVDSTRDAMRFAEHAAGRNAQQPIAAERRRNSAEIVRLSKLAPVQALNQRVVTTQILSFIHPTQNVEIILQGTAAPIFNAAGDLAGAIYVTNDVTTEMLRQGQRDAILSMVGHDLRNPLTPAKALLQQLRQTLRHEGRFEREIEDLDRVLEQLQRIYQISADIDAMSVMLYGGVPIGQPTCELVALCQDITRRQVERRPETPVQVEASAATITGFWGRKHLERVLIMLVASAARRTTNGKSVIMRLRVQSEKVKIEIRDQGEPLTEAQLAAMRVVLNRGGAALGMADGIDLDLAIVQTILGIYRSNLHVNATPRQGTTFWFSLPLPEVLA